MEATTNQVINFYSEIVKVPELLANGYQLILDFLLSHPQKRQATLLNLTCGHVPIITLILNVYPQQIMGRVDIPETQKIQTRRYLIKLILKQLTSDLEVNRKMVSNLFLLVSKIHSIEGYEAWVSFYEEALIELIKNNSKWIGVFLLSILKEADDRVYMLTKHVFKLLLTSNISLSIEETLQICYFCLKPMAFLHGTDDELLQEYINPYIPKVIELLTSYMINSIVSMKYSLKILTVLIGDYQVQCEKSLIKTVESTAFKLVEEYIKYLEVSHCNEDLEEDDENDKQNIETVMYQMFELFSALCEGQQPLNIGLLLYSAISGTYLSKSAYETHQMYSDQYVIAIEDEGEKTVRNKSIEIMQELLNNDQYAQPFKKYIRNYCDSILEIQNSANIIEVIKRFYFNNNLPATVLSTGSIYYQSVLFFSYALTDELNIQTNKITSTLGEKIMKNNEKNIDIISAMILLNKFANKWNISTKQMYFKFLKSLSQKQFINYGLLLVLIRGLMAISKQIQLKISEAPKENEISIKLLKNLVVYISKNDSGQNESGYLVLQFFCKLMKINKQHATLLKSLLPSEIQIGLLKAYLHDGITSQILIQLLSEIGQNKTISVVWEEIKNGHVKDDTLTSLMSKWISKGMVYLTQADVVALLRCYNKNIEMVSSIVKQFINLNIPSAELIQIINRQIHQSWVLILLKKNLLQNAENTFLENLHKVTFTLTSQYQLQMALLLPYYFFIFQTEAAIKLASKQNLFEHFITKLLRYGQLFKGNHLKTVTSNVLLKILQHYPTITNKVVKLIESYGKVEVDEWSDQQPAEEEEEEYFLNKVLSLDLVNQEAQQMYKDAFQEIAWDSSSVARKIEFLKNNSLKH